MTLLLLKLLLAPILVVASSLAGRRWGPAVTGMLIVLPIVAGPILWITYLEYGAHFAARAANASLLGLVSLALFVAVIARVARSHGWLITLSIGWITCLAADAALSFITVPPYAGYVLALGAAAIAMKTMPATQDEVQAPDWPWWDLPGRAVATGVLVLTLTAAAATLGPSRTGILAPFPIATSVVAAFVHAQRGAAATCATLIGVLRGLFGFATFCFLAAILVEPIGGWAFAVAAAGTVGVQAIGQQLRQRSATPATRGARR